MLTGPPPKFHGTRDILGGSTAAAFPSLTEREREVLELLAAGKGNATIAHELMISLRPPQVGAA